MSASKIISRKQLPRLLKKLRSLNRRIVFTNGCFDVLHLGHVTYLERARRMGDCLIVGLNSDMSVRRIKGRRRPINPWRDRAGVLSGLACVDYVTPFGEVTPLRIITTVRPHVLVKGSDWKSGDIVGAEETKSWGGAVRRVSLLKGRSTSRTIRRLRAMQGP